MGIDDHQVAREIGDPNQLRAALRPKWSAIQPAIGPPTIAPIEAMAYGRGEEEERDGGDESDLTPKRDII